jgi:hypothetical protein
MVTTYTREYALNRVHSEYGFQYYARLELDRAHRDFAVTGSVEAMLTTAMDCILAGCPDLGSDLLRKAESWIRHATAGDEQNPAYTPDFNKLRRAKSASLIHWLLHARDDSESLCVIAEMTDHQLTRTVQQEGKLDKGELSLLLPGVLDARAYPSVIAWLERLPKWVTPRAGQRGNNELHCCYFVAASRLGQGFEREQAATACERLFRQRFDEWMLAGHGTHVVRWLKVAFWNEEDSQQTPFATVLRCFDYLPSDR